jgi:hypothetical protein
MGGSFVSDTFRVYNTICSMEDNEKIKLLNAVKTIGTYFIVVAGMTYAKYKMYKSRRKITKERMAFITIASFVIGNTAGIACYIAGVHVMVSFAVVSAFTMLGESLFEVFVANSQATLLLIWDKILETLISWIESFKKKKK